MHQKIVYTFFSPFIFPNHKKIKRIFCLNSFFICFATWVAAWAPRRDNFRFYWKMSQKLISFFFVVLRRQCLAKGKRKRLQKGVTWTIFLDNSYAKHKFVSFLLIFSHLHMWIKNIRFRKCRCDTQNCYKWHFFYEYFIHYKTKEPDSGNRKRRKMCLYLFFPLRNSLA